MMMELRDERIGVGLGYEGLPLAALFSARFDVVGLDINESYESTGYPGTTEEDCTPLPEQVSALSLNEDFCVGCSPENVDPGYKEHRFATICKATAGLPPEAVAFIGSTISATRSSRPEHRAHRLELSRRQGVAAR